MTAGRKRLLLGLAGLVGGAVGGVIGWLAGDVVAGLFATDDGAGMALTFAAGGVSVGGGFGALVGVSSAQRILSQGR